MERGGAAPATARHAAGLGTARGSRPGPAGRAASRGACGRQGRRRRRRRVSSRLVRGSSELAAAWLRSPAACPPLWGWQPGGAGRESEAPGTLCFKLPPFPVPFGVHADFAERPVGNGRSASGFVSAGADGPPWGCPQLTQPGVRLRIVRLTGHLLPLSPDPQAGPPVWSDIKDCREILREKCLRRGGDQ